MLNDINFINIQSNLEVNIGIIKNIFIILCTYYTNFKVANRKVDSIYTMIYYTVYIIIIAIICSLIRYGVSYLISLIGIVLFIAISFSRGSVTKRNIYYYFFVDIELYYFIYICYFKFYN